MFSTKITILCIISLIKSYIEIKLIKKRTAITLHNFIRSFCAKKYEPHQGFLPGGAIQYFDLHFGLKWALHRILPIFQWSEPRQQVSL